MGVPAGTVGTSTVLSWLPWVGVIVVAGVVGGLLGPLGVLGRTTVEVVAGPTSTALLDREATGYACVGGGAVGTYPAGERVLAVERSADAFYLGVRDPYSFTEIVWVRASEVVLDGGAGSQELPVGGECPQVTTTLAAPPVVVVEEPSPEPEPSQPPAPPAPTPDTTAPSVGTPVFTTPTDNCRVVVTVSASDDRGVASVTLSWVKNLGGGAGSAPMTPQGGVWVFDASYTIDTAPFNSVPYTFTAVGRDAAGNSTQSASVTGTPVCIG